MKLKKGSIEAKRYMAKIRAKKKPVKKLGYSKDRLDIVKETTRQLKKIKQKVGYGLHKKSTLTQSKIYTSNI